MGQGVWAKMTGAGSEEETREANDNFRFAVFVLSSPEDAKTAAAAMKTGSGVVINGENLDSLSYQRVVDFLDGASYMFGGESRCVSDCVQIYVPPQMEIVDEIGSFYGNLTTGKKRFDG